MRHSVSMSLVNILTNHLGLIIDNIFIEFGRHRFHQIIGIPMGTNCVLLLVNRFLYSCGTEFIQKRSQDKKIQNLTPKNTEAKPLIFIFRYSEYVLFINNLNFTNWNLLIHPQRIGDRRNTIEEHKKILFKIP